MRCCERTVKGGGVGNRIPYRWYVESGFILMCVLALAPTAPLLSTFAVMYFVICNPILRHVLIFTYKPQFDAGGIRWPFIFDMVISSLLVGHILLATSMALKVAVGPAILASLLCVPTLVFRRLSRQRFLRAYEDAALLQTSLLDGWDTTSDSTTRTMQGREEFRQFLVDAHKACYVPVAVVGTNTDKILTAEPAVVVPTATDTDLATLSGDLPPFPLQTSLGPRNVSSDSTRGHQVGVVMRRMLTTSANVLPAAQLQKSLSLPSLPPKQQGYDSATEARPAVKVSSLGSIREGENGEKVYIFDSVETQKEK